MLKKLKQVIYLADDIEKARAWYSEVLGKQPYFDNSCYVGFHIGDCELGLLLNYSNRPRNLDAVICYWEVENIQKNT